MGHSEFLIAQRSLYGEYHNHKEQMAYAATVLYLTGAAWVIYAPPTRVSIPEIIFAIVITGAAFAFVIWQFWQRRIAADMVKACEQILARICCNSQMPELNDTRSYHDLLLPHFLVDELVDIAENRKCLRGTSLSELITYLVMLASVGIAFIQLLC